MANEKVPVVSLKREPEKRSLTVTVQGFAPLAVTLGSLEYDEMAALHGYGQKLVDAGAISRNSETGKPASPADKYAAIKAVYDRLTAGEGWDAPRGDGASSGLLFAAMQRTYPEMSPDQVREFLDGLADEEVRALPEIDPDLKANLKAIRDERDAKRAAGVDKESLKAKLAGLKKPEPSKD